MQWQMRKCKKREIEIYTTEYIYIYACVYIYIYIFFKHMLRSLGAWNKLEKAKD